MRLRSRLRPNAVLVRILIRVSLDFGLLASPIHLHPQTFNFLPLNLGLLQLHPVPGAGFPHTLEG